MARPFARCCAPPQWQLFGAQSYRALHTRSPAARQLPQWTNPIRHDLFHSPFWTKSPPMKKTIPRRNYATSRTPQSKSTSPRRPPTYVDQTTAVLQQLTSKSQPTLLYLAQTGTVFQQTCYATGGFCILYGAYHIYDIVLLPHPGLPWFVPLMMSGVCLSMMGLGVYILRACLRLVKRVSVVPEGGGGDGGARGILVRVERQTLFPWTVPKTVMARPHDVKLGSSIDEARYADQIAAGYQPRTEGGRRALAEQRLMAEEERKPKLVDTSNPFVYAYHLMGGVVNIVLVAFRKIIAREGFARLYVRSEGSEKAKMWRMDVKTGWLLDDGRPMERMFKQR